jgi:hypothetical protein
MMLTGADPFEMSRNAAPACSPVSDRNSPTFRVALQPSGSDLHLNLRQQQLARQMQQETTMFALIDFTRNTQRAMCLTLSAVIVAVSLSLGAYGSQAPLHPGYSVTITQLQ